MNILPLKLFEQKHSDCGIACISSIVNHCNPEIDYEKVKKISFKFDPRIKFFGTYSGQLGIILNKLKFRKVTIYSSNHDIVDFSWKNKKQEEIKSIFKEISVYGKNKECREDAFWYYKFLNKRSYENKLIVTSDFANIIRSYIDKYQPVLIDYNWSQIFNYPKYNKNNEPDYIRGHLDYHAVVVVGYNKDKVCVLDSHNKMHKSNKVENVENGCYYIRWEHLMVAMGCSDIIVPEKYGI